MSGIVSRQFGVQRMGRRLRAAVGALAVSLAVAGTAVPQVASAESLADAMASAYEHNGLIAQNRAVLRAADEDVAQAVAALRPIVAWSADLTRSSYKSSAYSSTFRRYVTGWSNSTDVTLSIAVSLLLYDFGATKLNIDIAKESVLATRQALVAAEQSVLLRAASAYLEVKRASEFVSLGEANVRVIGVELRAARDRFEVGEVTRTDVSIAEASLAASRAGLVANQGTLEQAVEEFRAAVGRKPGRIDALPPLPRLPKTLDQAKAIALRNHPDMLQLQHNVTVTELGILATQAAMKPTVSLSGSLTRSEDFGNPGFTSGGSIGVELSGPIYAGGQLASLKRKAIAQRDQTRALLHQTQAAVSQAVGNAWAQMQSARASRRASEEQVRASQTAFRGVREEATLGARTTLDVLNAEQDLLSARSNLVSSIIDEQAAAYRLLSAMGQLTADKLNLRVPRYDPAAYYNMVKDAPALYSKQGQKLDRVLKKLGKE
ncbi:TolC family outer membrane protein [Rhodalgimonas zhirmunskyi]|uniref:TolC family outer membrane protein n=1 Tax=Rhodalgimonas zhirmunskyi TaxID=2964767 RepID=A0AAJ1U933_9RHOB|nr:TolC family outer membrane protein [Rhodoalgimonas zhirmunskyi]MDQ2095581.1 TolC family outer membrane protein [Rhodoalgimonas zhirmunskyi]